MINWAPCIASYHSKEPPLVQYHKVTGPGPSYVTIYVHRASSYMGNAAPRIRHEATAPRSMPAVPSSGRTARRHGGKVTRDAVRRRQRGAEDEHKAGGGTTVAMTVKVVVTRKEAERLIARLEEHNTKERKARIAEITRRLKAGDGSSGESPASCGGTWRPRLAPIQEN
uniref:Uncharacterized protein n=1 Tax=Avena sativa TaxID=4498 RepID=A0ACD5VQG5_AVESA